MTLPQDLISRGVLAAVSGRGYGPSDGDDWMVGGARGHHGDISSPLPHYVRAGLIAMAFFGFLSLVSTTGLFLYISCRLLRWHLFFKHQQSRRRSFGALADHCSNSRPTQSDIPDYTMGLPQLSHPPPAARYLPRGSPGGTTSDSPGCSASRSRSPSPCPSFSDYHHQYEQHHNDASPTASRRGDSRDGRKGKKKSHKRYLSSSSTNTMFSATNTTTMTTTTSSLSAEVVTNPFLLLIYNLLLADMIQAASFLLSVAWLRYDATYSSSVTCWIQGWLSMTGKLSASACLVFASGLTYLTVVRGYRASSRALYACIAGVWLFTYVLAGAGVAITHNGRERGGWFTWSNGWCWVNSNYRVHRFWLGYLWIFLSVGVTILIYGAIFAAMLRRKKLSWRHMPDLDTASFSSSSPIRRSSRSQRDREDQPIDPQDTLHRLPSTASGARAQRRAAPPRPSGHHPAFLVYPFIYLVVTGPLATGRMLTMAGYGVSINFYMFSGALSAAHGFLNVVLWSTCIMLLGEREQEELGLDRFMRTPKERTYGNMVWIQGGTGPAVGDGRGSVGGTVRRGSWAQRLFGRVGSTGDGGGGHTIWHSQTTAKLRPWGAAAAAADFSSKYSLNRQTKGPSETEGQGNNNETTEMQILTTVTIETTGNDTTKQPKSLES